jgi:transcriptional regulator with XRE-family HTH domain
MAFEDHASDEAVLAGLGERLRAERLRRNLSQQQLAAEAGVGRMTVQRIEEGESGSLTSLVRILRALGELESLERLLPPSGPSPLEEVGRQGRRRQRARTTTRPESTEPHPATWRWGDEGSGYGD